MTFAVVDYIFFAIILIFLIVGLIKGFIDCIFDKLCWIAGLVLAYLFYKRLSEVFINGIKNRTASEILSFLTIFVIVFLVIKVVQLVIKKIFQFKILNSLDKTLGVFFGIIEGLCLVYLVIMILRTQPFFSVEKIFENSFFVRHLDYFLQNKKIIPLSVEPTT